MPIHRVDLSPVPLGMLLSRQVDGDGVGDGLMMKHDVIDLGP